MIFLIKLYTILDCMDCIAYQKVIEEYCSKTPTELQIIDTDDINNLSVVLDAKIQSIPYASFYSINGTVMFSIEGIHSQDEFEMIIYNNR